MRSRTDTPDWLHNYSLNEPPRVMDWPIVMPIDVIIMTTLPSVTPVVIYVSNLLGPYGFQLHFVYQKHICHAFITPIFLYCAITCRNTWLFITIQCNYVMGLNATIDHPECYQLGDLSSKIVTFSPRFIPIYLNYVNMC